MKEYRPSRPTGVAHGAASAVDLLRAIKYEEERTGQHQSWCYASSRTELGSSPGRRGDAPLKRWG